MAKTSKKKEPTMAEKRASVDRWLHSSFVTGAEISDNLYGFSKGSFDTTKPFAGLDDPKSVLYDVDDICKILSTKGEIDELFNALTVLYAAKKGIKLEFDPSGILLGHDEQVDETFRVLYRATMAIKGEEYRFRDVSNLYRIVSALSREEFLAMYPGFIEAVKNKCKALNGGTVALPRFFISKTFGDIVRQHGCKSVFNPFSGAGGLLMGLDSDVHYHGLEAYGVYSIFSRVIADAYGVENVSFAVGNPLTDWPDAQYDAVVFNLPTDCYFDDFENYLQKSSAYDRLHEDVFNLLLERRTARKLAIGLVRFPFISSYKFKDLRKRLFEEGLLESVICLPEEGVFSDSKIKTAIIVLDFEKKHTTADFYRGEFAVRDNHAAYGTVKSGGYNLIERTPVYRKGVGRNPLDFFKWKYIAALYANPIHCQDGEEAMYIDELATVIPIKKPKDKAGLNVSSRCYKGKFFDALNARNEYEFKDYNFSESAEVTGPCLLFRVHDNGSIQACMIREGEKVVYNSYNVYALRPKPEKVSLTCPEFQHYLTDCMEYNADDRVLDDIVLLGKIPVNPDLGAQKQFINESVKRYLVTQNRTYNIIWASDIWASVKPGSREAKQQEELLLVASQFGMKIISTPSTSDELAAALALYVDECTSSAEKADAVILDGKLSSGEKEEEPFDGLDFAIELKDKYAAKRIPFFLFSGASWEEIASARIKRRRLEYFKRRYFQGYSSEALESLLIKLQDEMGALGSREAEMRKKYAAVFKAADRFNDKNVQRVLTEALDEEFSSELSLRDTEDKFNKLRIIAEGMLQNLAKMDILPTINFGAQVDFLADGRFDDWQVTLRFYHADKRLMSTTLSSAFRYFRLIVAGGSHTATSDKVLDVVDYVSKESKNSDLYKSALYILMDILLWYEGILDAADKDPDSVIGRFTSVPRGKEEVIGTVEMDEDGTLYCGHIKLNTSATSSLKVGDKVSIRKSNVDTKKPTSTLWFYANTSDYTVLPKE